MPKKLQSNVARIEYLEVSLEFKYLDKNWEKELRKKFIKQYTNSCLKNDGIITNVNKIIEIKSKVIDPCPLFSNFIIGAELEIIKFPKKEEIILIKLDNIGASSYT